MNILQCGIQQHVLTGTIWLAVLLSSTELYGQTGLRPQALSTGPTAVRSNPQDSQASAIDSLGQNLFERVAQSADTGSEGANGSSFFMGGPEKWTSREGLSSSLQVILLLTVLSLAPAVLLMTTCYVRIIVVLGLLRQALGTGQLPPSQVITSIALFMTMFIMTPVWNQVYQDAIGPYTATGSTMSLEQAWNAGVEPVRRFMSRQIDMAGNHDDVHLFLGYYAPNSQAPENMEDVPMRVLLPAYMLSELKISFLMGFQIFLPFLLIDLVVAAVTISMGMMMLPPAMISLPFKLLLFVLIDGWHLVVGMLLDSFGTQA
jgi:flagellar biosynthesis protein FliP